MKTPHPMILQNTHTVPETMPCVRCARCGQTFRTRDVDALTCGWGCWQWLVIDAFAELRLSHLNKTIGW